ncbi:MAG: beta-lactamase family protein [Alphaproteobacteria bacterium]|nr:beta-lactamase family protein [Alphaproteobacteria bacterium]
MQLSKARLGRLGHVMRAHAERGTIAGAVVLVSRGDEVHAEAVGLMDLETGAPMRRDTIFRIASMSKPITAAAALMLVEEGRLRLDEPVDAWLPELANRRVLRSLDAALDDTVPAERPITLRDLLTFRAGLGAVMAPPSTYAIQRAMADAGIQPGPDPLPFGSDAFMQRVGGLPLMHQPGAQWMYHTASDILGVLIARAADMSLSSYLQARVFGPLGMADTAFNVPAIKRDRLATAYATDGDRLKVYDAGRSGKWTQAPAFESGGGGLISTADDYLAFGRMLLRGGRAGTTRLLARPTVALMTRDHLSAAQKAASTFVPGFWDRSGWGFGLSVVTRCEDLSPSVGSFGWDGGFTTSCYVDPQEDLVAVLLTQRLMTSPSPTAFYTDFWTLVYQSIDD